MRDDFREEEIAYISRKNKRTNQMEVKKFPLVGGRLRLFHEDRDNATDDEFPHGIKTNIIQYDGSIAVVQADVIIAGDTFQGIGMASEKRDNFIFPAILELAETRAIARALRFAGYGVEYTGAEEMGGMKDIPEDAPSVQATQPANQPVQQQWTGHHQGQEQKPAQQASPKRQVWEFIRTEYPNEDQSTLAKEIGDFIRDVSEKRNCTEVQVMNSILEYRDEFKRVFGKRFEHHEPEPEADTPDVTELRGDDKVNELMDAAREMHRQEHVISPKPEAPVAEGKLPRSESNKLKAKVLMALPDGVNVSAINSTLTMLFEANSELTELQVYEHILQDIVGFTEILVDHCQKNGLDAGIPGTEVPEEPTVETPEEPIDIPPEVEDVKVTATNEMSDFRKSWYFLGFEKFDKFLVQNKDQFLADRSEYIAALAKFEKAKVKAGKPDMIFPFKFEIGAEPKLSNKDSVIKEPETKVKPEAKDIILVMEYSGKWPKMAKKVEEACGISQYTTDPKEAEVFLDELNHQVLTYQTKTGKVYDE